MNKTIIHTRAFRILAPLVYGVIAYLLVLLSFDRLDNILFNFEWIEFAFCLLVSILLFEFLHLGIQFRFRQELRLSSQKAKVFVEIVAIGLISLLLLAIILYSYFRIIWSYQNFSSFAEEFYILHIIFSLGSIAYLLFCASLLLLNARNEEELLREKEKEQEVERALGQLTRDIHPALFFKTLEEILSLVPEHKSRAEALIGQLSTLYRGILAHRTEPWIRAQSEIEQLQTLINIYRHWANGEITLQGEPIPFTFFLIPGSLRMLLSELFPLAIFSKAHPFRLSYQQKEALLTFDFLFFERIGKELEVQRCFERFEQSYEAISSMEVQWEKGQHIYHLSIPLLLLEDSISEATTEVL